mgnify:CR=1 FL=1
MTVFVAIGIAVASAQTPLSPEERAEIERWNQILTSPKPAFNTAPNTFLVGITNGLKRGRSLDVGMGQGRNTIYLAQQGWDSNGFDPADRAGALGERFRPGMMDPHGHLAEKVVQQHEAEPA